MRRLTSTLAIAFTAVAVAAPAAGAQDLRNPDNRVIAAHQDVRSPDTRDVAQGRSVQAEPATPVAAPSETVHGSGGSGVWTVVIALFTTLVLAFAFASLIEYRRVARQTPGSPV